MSFNNPTQIFAEDVTEEKGENARLSAFVGAIAVGDLVKSTLGPKGMDKILQSASTGEIMVTNDGATILKAIALDNAAAKVLVNISKVQDDEVGDGTTSVTVLAAELLREAEKLVERKIHPQVIIDGYRIASKAALEALEHAAVDNSSDPAAFRKDLHSIARTTLSSKVLAQDREQFANLACDAVLRLKGSTDLSHIQIIKKAGGKLSDSYLDEGFILDKKIGVNQPKRLENAKILVANTAMDTDKVKIFGARVKVDSTGKLAELEKAEKEKMKAKVDRIKSHGINCFVNRQLIYNWPEQLFTDAGIVSIEHADFDGIERLALVTGGEIASTFDHPDQVKLGHCDLIEEVIIGEDTLIKFSGVAAGQACTIVLRGATEQLLDEAERSLHDALAVLSQTVKEPKVTLGGGCAEMIMSRAVEQTAQNTTGKKQLAVDAFALALRQLPTILADNAGLDSSDLVTRLRQAINKGLSSSGLDLLKPGGGIANMRDLGVVESYKLKKAVVSSASEAAELLLRVDNIIRSAPRKRERVPLEIPHETESISSAQNDMNLTAINLIATSPPKHCDRRRGTLLPVMSLPVDYTLSPFDCPASQELAYAPSSDSTGSVGYPLCQPVAPETRTMTPAHADHHRSSPSGFRLSSLSPFQLERACFTPHGVGLPLANPNFATGAGAPLSQSGHSNQTTDPSTTLEKALSTLSALELRFAEQESRIQELEAKVSRQQTLPRPSPEAVHAPKSVPILDLLEIGNDPEPDHIPGAKSRGDEMHAHILESSAASTKYSSSTGLASELVGFEEIFERKSAQAPQNSYERSAHDQPQTLLEGIGSAMELTHHRRIDSRSNPGSSLLLDMGDSPPRNNSSSEFSVSSGNQDRASDCSVLPGPIPWDGKISWKTVSVFENVKDIANTLCNQPPEMASRGLFQDDLVFKPRQGDLNVYRTVAVLNLPDNIDMKTFLKGIRGGCIYSAHLHNTLYISGSHMGVVTFIFQTDAIAYAEFAAKNGVYFNGKRAEVVLFKTPTYPISEVMERYIFDLGHTRCLSIRGESDPERFTMIAKFMKDNSRMYFDLGDQMVENETKTEIIVRFNSVQAAAGVMAKLEKFPLLYGCDIDFDIDPCSEPLPGPRIF
ncbi:T-complex protein 1 subunit beta [Uncinocarpus reesii 1704]|uniref:CCT-beta n=1 Tax=Uncinocarpus reesii (strain UAMH 1704) TaxID=336963 RepID=C4JUB6_UNCRE|nr:T-complex protein 1 subunit beta [Uncinocarpus reesii 1704]EEP81213.1 T-complex protein 1 subunit beta [Uncinocarpus reesii 1704]